MLVHTNNMPDISNLKPRATGCFLAGMLVGKHSSQSLIDKKLLPILARLIDKAISEYSYARDCVEEEENERKMTYEEILRRGQGQPIYTCPIINHLENCITTLARIYKLKKTHLGHAKNQDIIDIRDSVEHVEERIRESVDEPPVLNISGESIVIEVAARNSGKIQIKTKDLAEVITELYKEIRSML